MLEELRGLGFSRAMMPEDAANSRARPIVKVDAALEILMISVYIGFVSWGWMVLPAVDLKIRLGRSKFHNPQE